MRAQTLSLLLAIPVLFISTLASAKTICRGTTGERNIEVIYLAEGKKIPCHVMYTKEDGESEVIFEATNSVGYCEKRASDFISQLREKKMNCAGELAQK